MLSGSILEKSTVLWVLITFSALAWGAQKKTSAPPQTPPKPAQQVKPAPTPKQPNPKPPQPLRPIPARHSVGLPSTLNSPDWKLPGPNPTPATRSFSTPHGTKDVDMKGNVTQFRGTDGKEAHFGSKGEINEIRDPRRNMVIQRGLRGGDTKIVTVRNGRRLVSMGRYGGYSERPYLNHNGHTYYQRTYWNHGHAYARVYREQFYRGMHYYRYVPAYYYPPAFYGWASSPWAAPVSYNWGWGAAPWFYGGYFAPAPSYPSASLWLTDYLLSEDLRQAYAAKQEAQGRADAEPAGDQPPGGGAPTQAQLSADQIKEMVDAEVQQQLAEERAAAQAPQAAARPAIVEAPPPALDPKQRLFVVSNSLGVGTAEGGECELTPGDVITRIDDTPTGSKVRVSVMSSKQNDCSVGAMPMVAVDDLQEMHNSFHAQIDSGLQTLAVKAGTDGLPKAPDAQSQAGEVPPPVPDNNVDAQLADQQREAAQSGAEVRQEVPAANN